MHYHLLLTEKCNKDCRYCGGYTHGPLQEDISYDPGILKEFMERDPEASVSFYGGEPTLNIPALERIMDTVRVQRFGIQTNATHLDRIGPDYLERMHTILISIDGDRDITDHYRGPGTYDRAIKNGWYARDNGFKGDMVARMAISNRSDVFRDVSHLVEHDLFNNVHWQLDVLWSREGWQDLPGWMEGSYNPGISRLVRSWIDVMEQQGIVQGIVPFKALIGLMLRDERARLWCGAGRDCFAITPRGEIMACPIAPTHGDLRVGSIQEDTPQEIRNTFRIETPCTECGIFGICGGRCLFANRTREWYGEEFGTVCGSVSHLIERLQAELGTIEALIENGTVPEQDFDYPPDGNNSCEIIP